MQKQLESGNLEQKEIEKAKAGQKQDFPRGIPECGADAMRFALCAYQGSNRDINLDIMRVEGYRKFCNKLWNATRFALMKLGSDFVPNATEPKKAELTTLPQKWIMHRLNVVVEEVNQTMADYNFIGATSAIHRFWLYELCDVFIEAIKPVVDGEGYTDAVKKTSKNVLYTALDYGLRLIHPFMPFVSEELFQRLGRRPGDAIESIMLAAFPEPNPEWKNEDAVQSFDTLNSVVKSIRSLATDYGLRAKATGKILHALITILNDTISLHIRYIRCISRNVDVGGGHHFHAHFY